MKERNQKGYETFILPCNVSHIFALYLSEGTQRNKLHDLGWISPTNDKKTISF